ncbi:SatD family protein [Algoriphagus sp. SE2]|uniref:SatD family protein n=1 Tax=Algoriphagus sp. SE2 TaxID=3141536 RepID=UPI0031CD4E03
MIRRDIHAVITGDLVNSTAITKDYHDVLYRIADDIQAYQLKDFKFDIYRGDSFQALVSDPNKALLISIIMRSGLRRYSNGTSIADAWDARVSVGIGEISSDPNGKLGQLIGEAFVRSGRGLETMKKEGLRLKITTGEEQIDREFESTCPLADHIISRWTTSQAEAIYLSLLKGITQTEIGEELNQTQRVISKRLESGNLESLSNFFNRFKEIITWKFSN